MDSQPVGDFADHPISTDDIETLKLEIERKTAEGEDLDEKVAKSKLSIEHLERMIEGKASELAQLKDQLIQIETALSHKIAESDLQKNYQEKEIATLKAELESLESLHEGRITCLERINRRNAAFQSEIASNQYKILCMHFNCPIGESDRQSSQSVTTSISTDTSMTSTSDDNSETSNCTTSTYLEFTETSSDEVASSTEIEST